MSRSDYEFLKQIKSVFHGSEFEMADIQRYVTQVGLRTIKENLNKENGSNQAWQNLFDDMYKTLRNEIYLT